MVLIKGGSIHHKCSGLKVLLSTSNNLTKTSLAKLWPAIQVLIPHVVKLTAKYSQHNYSLLRFYINVREEKELIWNGFFFFFFVGEKRNRKESFRNIKLILDGLSLILSMILGYITYILPYLGYFQKVMRNIIKGFLRNSETKRSLILL